jgi:hypothetical protein
MSAPSRFIISAPFTHRSPDDIRLLLEKEGFRLMTPKGLAKPETWSKPSGDGGHWLVRIDSQGHDTDRHFGARPHYHKNWVDSDELLAAYLKRFTPQAWIYSDAGVPIGLAGSPGTRHPDQQAKLQHIPR